MKSLLTGLLILVAQFSFAQPDISDLRVMYEQANESEAVAVKMLSYEDDYQNNYLALAYLAGTEMMMAKHSWNPVSKYQYFVSGRDKLEQLLNQHSDDFELRYLRLVLQSNIPSFLGYDSNLTEDKLYMVNHINDFVNETDKSSNFRIKVLNQLEELSVINAQEVDRLRQMVQ